MLTEHFDALTKNMENHCKKFGDEVDALAKKFEDPNLFWMWQYANFMDWCDLFYVFSNLDNMDVCQCPGEGR